MKNKNITNKKQSQIKHKEKKPVKKSNHDLLQSFSKWGYLIIIVAAIAVYFQTLMFDFTKCDDDLIITKNEFFSQVGNIPKAFTEPYFGGYYYRPVIITSFIIDAVIGGKSAFIYHLTNLIYHIITCCLVFYLFKLLKYNNIGSLFAGLLYAVHPLFTNAVSWILGRNDLLMTLFGLLAFIFFIKHRRDKAILNLILHFIFFILAVLSKEGAFVLPLLFIAYLIVFEKSKLLSGNNIIYYLLWISTIILWNLLRYNATSSGVSEGDFAISNFFNNIALVPELISKLILPVNNAVLPTYNIVTTITGLIFITGLIYLIIKKKDRRNNYMIFGALWFFILAVPGMFISLRGKTDYFDYLDCRTYLPVIGMIIIIFEALPTKFFNFKQIKFLFIYLLIIVALGGINIFHSRNYANPLNFYGSAVKNNPTKARFHCQLGLAYMDSNKIELAAKEFTESTQLNPKEPEYFSKLGLIFYRGGNFPKAIESFEQGLKAPVRDGELIANLGAAYNENKQFDKAINVLRKGIDIKKYENAILMNLTNAFAFSGQYDSAYYYGMKLRAKGDNVGLINLYIFWAMDSYNKGNLDDAIEKNKIALKYGPNSDRVYNNLGALFMVKGDYAQSEQSLKRAMEINPEALEPLNNLFKLNFSYTKNYPLAAKYATEVRRRGGTIDAKSIEFLKQYR
jgi:protein O-mannosyl-transferase